MSNLLKNKIEQIIEKKPREIPTMGGWIAERKSDGRVSIDVTDIYEGEEFVCVKQVIEYINYIISK